MKIRKENPKKKYGPVFNTEKQQWELRSNTQQENLYKKENIVQFIKSIIMQYAGHSWRADGHIIKKNNDVDVSGKETKRKTMKMDRQRI